jgi:hypothetical protein
MFDSLWGEKSCGEEMLVKLLESDMKISSYIAFKFFVNFVAMSLIQNPT